MRAEDVNSIYNWLKENEIIIWVDGGWCVDALLGKQTREHPDLDIAVNRKDNAKLRKLLEDAGYEEESRNDSAEWMYVMKNTDGKQIDVHVFEYDENGKNIYGIEYPYGSLTGKGTINGQEVNCVDPQWMFKFKTSYEPKQKDLADVQALASKYSFELPATHTSSQT
jgi:lincosamide nucleotidyltransferase A/C/D/E